MKPVRPLIEIDCRALSSLLLALSWLLVVLAAAGFAGGIELARF